MRNTIARTACFVTAPALVAAGAGGWAMVSRQLSDERIDVHPKSPILAGKPVAGPLTAFAQANVIKQNAQGICDGATFAEISQQWFEAQKSGDKERADELFEMRRNRMQADLLRATLLTSVLAFGVSALAGGMGVLTGLVGSALPRE